MGAFYAPDSLTEVVKLKDSIPNAFYLAGGTMLNIWRTSPSNITYISLHRLGLNKVEKRDGRYVLGAMLSLSSLAEYFTKEGRYPEIVRSCKEVARNIRNMATVGGSIGSQITRSDLTPVLLALGAELSYVSVDGEGSVSLADYTMEFARLRKCLITSVSIKDDPKVLLRSSRYARSKNDNPVVKTVCAYKCVDGKISDISITAGGLTSSVLKLVPLEIIFEGKSCATAFEEAREDAILAVSSMKNPPNDLLGSGEFKKVLLISQLEDIFTDMQEVCC